MSPIRPENRSLYPPDWPAIRARILARARHRCERCGARNHALGYRTADGAFIPSGGNRWHDDAGFGALPYAEVAEAAAEFNEFGDGLGPNGERAIVIVLTIAHLNHQPDDSRDENLQALCQRCHNRLDVASRRAGIRERRFADQRRFDFDAAVPA